MSSPQSAQEIEAAAQRDIAALTQQIFQYLNSVPLSTLSGRPLTSGELTGVIGGFTPFAAKFDELLRTAAWLRDQGRPNIQSQLDVLIPDFFGALAKYREMYDDRTQIERGIVNIFAEANRVVQQNIKAATDNTNKMFQRKQKAIMDVMAQNCFYCHRYIGIPGGGYHVECAQELLRTGVLRNCSVL